MRQLMSLSDYAKSSAVQPKTYNTFGSFSGSSGFPAEMQRPAHSNFVCNGLKTFVNLLKSNVP